MFRDPRRIDTDRSLRGDRASLYNENRDSFTFGRDPRRRRSPRDAFEDGQGIWRPAKPNMQWEPSDDPRSRLRRMRKYRWLLEIARELATLVARVRDVTARGAPARDTRAG